jgi:hypothetical protein
MSDFASLRHNDAVQRWIGFAVVLVMAALVASQGLPEAQQPAAPRMARMPDGKPNLNGIWQANNSANHNVEDHEAYGGPAAWGAIGAAPAGYGFVEGGEIPYKPEALAKRKANFENRLTLDPEVKCYLPGVPRAMYMPFPFQIVQDSRSILMAFEYASAARQIDLVKMPSAPVDTWMGYSGGKWQGDTLVIESKGFNDQSWFDRAGNFHSEALRVVERITPVGPDALNYEATLEDPNVFTRPWKITMPLYRRLEKNLLLLEFKCAEFAEELMYGHLKKPGDDGVWRRGVR